MIRKYPLQCYRLDGASNAVVATEERTGKYSGAVVELDGRQVPHGVGTFKTSTGYMWTGMRGSRPHHKPVTRLPSLSYCHW